MITVLVELVLAPSLAAASTLAAGRWGPHFGGVVSAFPAIVGPVLLILTFEHGGAFAARAAAGTVLGLVSLSAFALTYGGCAARYGWRVSLAAGWAAAALTGTGVGLGLGLGIGLGIGSGGVSLLTASGVAAVSLLIAWGALARRVGRTPATHVAACPRPEPMLAGMFVRMASTALLVSALAVGAAALGPLIGGMLAALPILASVLTVVTHREAGAEAATALLRGTVAGMGGFLVFCGMIALLLTDHPALLTFGIATAAAVVTQAGAVAVGRAGTGLPRAYPD